MESGAGSIKCWSFFWPIGLMLIKADIVFLILEVSMVVTIDWGLEEWALRG